MTSALKVLENFHPECMACKNLTSRIFFKITFSLTYLISSQHMEKRSMKSWNFIDMAQKFRELWISRWICGLFFAHGARWKLICSTLHNHLLFHAVSVPITSDVPVVSQDFCCIQRPACWVHVELARGRCARHWCGTNWWQTLLCHYMSMYWAYTWYTEILYSWNRFCERVHIMKEFEIVPLFLSLFCPEWGDDTVAIFCSKSLNSRIWTVVFEQ